MRAQVQAAGLRLFVRANTPSAPELRYPLSRDQSAAERLNRAMAEYLNDPDWGNAYAQTDLRDTLAEFAAGARAAFGSKIVGIKPTDERFNQFNGINRQRTAYVNLGAKPGFISSAGHELPHDIKRQRSRTPAMTSTEAKSRKS